MSMTWNCSIRIVVQKVMAQFNLHNCPSFYHFSSICGSYQALVIQCIYLMASSSAICGSILVSFFIGYVLTQYAGVDNAITVTGENLSFALPRQPSMVQFPYFFFFTGVFYGFVLGVILTGYLTWHYILKPKNTSSGSKGKTRHASTSPARPRRTYANAVVQGPVTYNPQLGKKRAYDPLSEKFWGAWWY